MATHCSVLAWRIPWTEEAGGLQSMGSQKRQTRLSDWTTQAQSSRAGYRHVSCPCPRDDGGAMLTGWLQTHELPLPQGQWGHHADGVGERSRRCLQLCRPEDLHRDYRTRLPCGKSSQSSHVHKQAQLSIKLYWQREGSGPDVAAAGPMPGVEFSWFQSFHFCLEEACAHCRWLARQPPPREWRHVLPGPSDAFCAPSLCPENDHISFSLDPGTRLNWGEAFKHRPPMAGSQWKCADITAHNLV